MIEVCDGSVSGTAAYALRNLRPRAATRLNDGVDTFVVSGPMESARVVSSVTRRMDGSFAGDLPPHAINATHTAPTKTRDNSLRQIPNARFLEVRTPHSRLPRSCPCEWQPGIGRWGYFLSIFSDMPCSAISFSIASGSTGTKADMFS